MQGVSTAQCKVSRLSTLRTVCSSTPPQLWCLIWLWRCTVWIECRGSSRTSNLSWGLKPSRRLFGAWTRASVNILVTCLSYHSNVLITLLTCFLPCSTGEYSWPIPPGWHTWHHGLPLGPRRSKWCSRPWARTRRTLMWRTCGGSSYTHVSELCSWQWIRIFASRRCRTRSHITASKELSTL
jgi:hypothetical protein